MSALVATFRATMLFRLVFSFSAIDVCYECFMGRLRKILAGP